MMTPPPGEPAPRCRPPRRRRRARPRDPIRHVTAMWAEVLRRFRNHLRTTSEDTDGRIH
jgi:hypothetical protein